jgi:hypothetical protein
MANYINKESWCKDKLHNKKFHYKNVTSKWCPGCRDPNPDLINNSADDLSDVNEFRRPLNPKHERFTQLSENAEFYDLT